MHLSGGKPETCFLPDDACARFYVSGMPPNRSIPASTVVPVLVYPDVRAAVAWLEEAFGFAERVRVGEDHRAQLAVGDGAVIVADVRGDRIAPADGVATHLVMVRVGDARAHCARAEAAGARVVDPLTDHVYGERQYTAVDPWGHRWTFSETLDDVAPEDWGGIAVTG
jgi:uncharacterized glyoxalase superfamily protein PhnB